MTIEELMPSAVEKFKASAQAAQLVTDGILGTDPDGMMWVFQGSDDDRPFRDPEGTGKAAIVFTVNDIWGTNNHNTVRLPVLTALAYVDASRNASGEILRRDGKHRALRVSELVRDAFHDPANVEHVWPLDVVVYSCVCTGWASVLEVPDSDGMHRSAARFNIMM